MMADITEEGSPDRFELFHTVDGNAERLEIHKCKDGDDAGDVAQLLFDSARQDADTRDNKYQRYTVALFRHADQQEPEVQFPFRIQARPGTNWTGGDTEQPTEKGERAQLMRIQNETHSIMMRFAESFGGRFSSELDKVRAEREKLEEKLRSQALAMEDLQDRRLDRELQRSELLQRQKFYGDLMSSLLPLVPHIAGGILSKVLKPSDGSKNGHESSAAKALVPANAEQSSRETILKEMFANMTDEEKQGLFTALNPMNRMALVTLIQGAGSATTELEKAAFDSGMQKFLKSLTSEEFANILSVLDQGNRNRFLLVYQSYGKSEAAAQEGLPDILKDAAEQKKPEPPEEDAITV